MVDHFDEIHPCYIVQVDDSSNVGITHPSRQMEVTIGKTFNPNRTNRIGPNSEAHFDKEVVLQGCYVPTHHNKMEHQTDKVAEREYVLHW